MWNIVPYQSVGPLRFGMTTKEVAAILGPAETTDSGMSPGASWKLQWKYRHYSVEHRIGIGPETIKPSIQYNAGQLVSVEYHRDFRERATLNGIDIFQEPKSQTNALLMALSRDYAVGYDSYIFLDLGISMSVDDTWECAPSINIFANGQFDDLVAEDMANGTMQRLKK